MWSSNHCWIQSWPRLNGHSLNHWSIISSIFRYFWTLPVSLLKENSSLKCFQFSRYCKSLSKVTQTNDTELSSKNILEQNTVWSNKRDTELKIPSYLTSFQPSIHGPIYFGCEMYLDWEEGVNTVNRTRFLCKVKCLVQGDSPCDTHHTIIRLLSVVPYSPSDWLIAY